MTHLVSRQKLRPWLIHPWVIQPLIFIFAVWILNYNLIAVKEYTPDIFFGLWQHNSHSLDEYIPPLPNNLTQLFRLGELFGRLSCNSTDQQLIQEIAILLQMGEFPHGPLFRKWCMNCSDRTGAMTLEMDVLKHRLVELTLQGSLLSRILGAFSFVNVLWLCSLCGIVVLFYPCIRVLFGSMIEVLYLRVINLVIFISFFIEPASYIYSFFLVVQGFRYLPEVGLLISLTGSLFLGSLMFYSDRKHRDHTQKYNRNLQKIKQQLFYLFLTLSLIPLAILYQSQLYGFLAVATFFGFLGFSIICQGLCWLIGYEDEDAMHTTSACSLVLMTVFILIRLKVIVVTHPQWVQPFSTGILTFGMIAYFLAQLILSSKYYTPSEKYCKNRVMRDSPYFNNQLIMIASLFLALLIGNIYQLAPLYNIGLTFMVMYVIEKIFEIDSNQLLIPILFLTCIIVYLISLYLFTHPDFMVNLFDSSLTHS